MSNRKESDESRKSSMKSRSGSMSGFVSAMRNSFNGLDSFLMQDRSGDRAITEDAGSFVMELRQLRQSEEELRQELDGIVPEKPMVPYQQQERPSAIRRSSSLGLKRQVSEESVRNLQEQLYHAFHSQELSSSVASLDTSGDASSIAMKRLDTSTSSSKTTEMSSVSFVERVAMVVFGRHEYTIKPKLTLAKQPKPHIRVVQGGVVVAIVTAVIVARVFVHSILFPVLLVLVPPLVAWIEVNLPHAREETTIALCALAVHCLISNLYAD